MANDYEKRLFDYYDNLKLNQILEKEDYQELGDNKEKNIEIVKNYVKDHTDIYYNQDKVGIIAFKDIFRRLMTPDGTFPLIYNDSVVLLSPQPPIGLRPSYSVNDRVQKYLRCAKELSKFMTEDQWEKARETEGLKPFGRIDAPKLTDQYMESNNKLLGITMYDEKYPNTYFNLELRLVHNDTLIFIKNDYKGIFRYDANIEINGLYTRMGQFYTSFKLPDEYGNNYDNLEEFQSGGSTFYNRTLKIDESAPREPVVKKKSLITNEKDKEELNEALKKFYENNPDASFF